MIRKLEQADREKFLEMAQQFYKTDAVTHPIPLEYHEKAFEEIVSGGVYAEGYIFEREGKTAGYAILAKTFSQEAGGIVVWIEEIYILKAFRSKGMGKEFFDYLESDLQGKAKRLRLEVVKGNERAIKLYEGLGFSKVSYKQMFKEL